MATQTQAQKRINLILGGKGGTGKTLFARLLYYALSEADIKVIGIDSDIENPEFAGYHADVERFSVSALDFLSLSQGKKLFSLLTGQLEEKVVKVMPRLAAQCPPDVVVIDMPGASGHQCREQMDLFGFIPVCKELGYAVTIVTVLNNGYSPIDSLGAMMEFCQDTVDYLAVKSLFWKFDDQGFVRWQTSKPHKQFKKYGGKEIEMPVLPTTTFDALQDKSTSFFEVDSLDLGDKLLALSFLRRGLTQLETVADILGLPVKVLTREAA